MNHHIHIPGRPKTPEPPELSAIASALQQHPSVLRSGITTTAAGNWAVLVVVPPDTPTPIEEVEQQCRKFPVIYQEDSGRMPIARPAFPGLGE